MYVSEVRLVKNVTFSRSNLSGTVCFPLVISGRMVGIGWNVKLKMIPRGNFASYKVIYFIL